MAALSAIKDPAVSDQDLARKLRETLPQVRMFKTLPKGFNTGGAELNDYDLVRDPRVAIMCLLEASKRTMLCINTDEARDDEFPTEHWIEWDLDQTAVPSMSVMGQHGICRAIVDAAMEVLGD